jgi:hypothetical protein
MSDSFDVIMTAYTAADSALRDFDAVVELVKDKTVKSEGVILVEHAADGRCGRPRPATTWAARLRGYPVEGGRSRLWA